MNFFLHDITLIRTEQESKLEQAEDDDIKEVKQVQVDEEEDDYEPAPLPKQTLEEFVFLFPSVLPQIGTFR